MPFNTTALQFRLAIAPLLVASALFALSQPARAQQSEADRLFERGATWTAFLEATHAQRDLWLTNTASAHPPQDLVDRMRRAAGGLRLLVVAEDWCPDSVNALPHVAALASTLSIPLRIVDRTVGAPLMNRHRTPDGRVATPTIVLLRGHEEVAAWVERPAEMQRWFLSMATSPESAKRFSERQAWYDRDGGRTVLSEFVSLAEQPR